VLRPMVEMEIAMEGWIAVRTDDSEEVVVRVRVREFGRQGCDGGRRYMLRWLVLVVVLRLESWQCLPCRIGDKELNPESVGPRNFTAIWDACAPRST